MTIDNTKEKIEKLRSEAIRILLMFFFPQLIICIITSSLVKDPINTLSWQLIWFSIYFLGCLYVYVAAPRITKRKFKRN